MSAAALVLRGSASSIYVEHICKSGRSQGVFRDVTSDSWLKLSINFACLPRETGKARALEIDLRRVEANLSTGEEEKLSNKYMQKEILHTNRQ